MSALRVHRVMKSNRVLEPVQRWRVGPNSPPVLLLASHLASTLAKRSLTQYGDPTLAFRASIPAYPGALKPTRVGTAKLHRIYMERLSLEH